MIDITRDIQSLTTFRRRSGEFMKRLKRNKRLEDAKQGKVQPAREFFEEFEAGHGIPR
jgi:hypothetical protein